MFDKSKMTFLVFLTLIAPTLLRAMEVRHQFEIHPMHDELVTKIYQWESPWLLHIPQEKLSAVDEIKNLQELFGRYNIVPDDSMIIFHEPKPWQEHHWAKAVEVLKERAEIQEKLKSKEIGIPELIQRDKISEYVQKKIRIDELPNLLEMAKTVLKSFLPHSISMCDDEKSFIRKYGNLGRLFTYVQLQRTIEKKGLSHVDLPQKFLLIKDKESGKYLEKEEASNVLDEIITIAAFPPFTINAKIHWYSTRYELSIMAERKKNARRPFNILAHQDLETLVSEAPFDMGYDNIFSDDEGNAIVIDTEFKGENAQESLAKLNARYPHEKKTS